MEASESETRRIVRAYHEDWTHGRFDAATARLTEELCVEVPLNRYPDRASFAKALAAFAAVVEDVELLAEFFDDDEGMLLYDLNVTGLGPLRVAEHFTLANGRIVRLRQIHDTATLRAKGFGS